MKLSFEAKPVRRAVAGAVAGTVGMVTMGACSSSEKETNPTVTIEVTGQSATTQANPFIPADLRLAFDRSNSTATRADEIQIVSNAGARPYTELVRTNIEMKTLDGDLQTVDDTTELIIAGLGVHQKTPLVEKAVKASEFFWNLGGMRPDFHMSFFDQAKGSEVNTGVITGPYQPQRRYTVFTNVSQMIAFTHSTQEGTQPKFSIIGNMAPAFLEEATLTENCQANIAFVPADPSQAQHQAIIQEIGCNTLSRVYPLIENGKSYNDYLTWSSKPANKLTFGSIVANYMQITPPAYEAMVKLYNEL